MARKVTQNHGTEPPFSSPLNSNKKPGLYNCVVCNTPVFGFEYLTNNFILLFFFFYSKNLVRNINLIVELVGQVFFHHIIHLVLLQKQIMH